VETHARNTQTDPLKPLLSTGRTFRKIINGDMDDCFGFVRSTPSSLILANRAKDIQAST
jgi:hypothetical protein